VKKKVLVITPFHETGMDILNRHPDIDVIVSEDISESAIIAAVADVHAIIVRNAIITRAIVEAANQLEVVSRTGVGYDNVDIPALNERGIPLTITPNANATSVAEHVMYLMLSLAKQGRVHHAAVRDGNFGIRFEMRARDVEDKCLLIVGFGRVGSRLAPRAEAFGMRVHVNDPFVDRAVIESAGYTYEGDLAAALPSADVVSLHCPLTELTRHLISEAELRAMKTSSFVINTARGGVVDERALLAALTHGVIAGAGLDVFDAEPPATDDPLLAMPNVVLTPHHAGVSLEAAERAGVAVANNTINALFGTLDPVVVVNSQTLGERADG